MRQRMTDMGLWVLRICVGILMLTHGIPKLLDYRDGTAAFPDPLGIGSELSAQLVIGAEVGCVVLMILGLLTRLAVVPLLITMLVAALVHHAGDPWASKELPLLYAACFLAILLTGPGERSIDGWLGRRVRGLGKKPSLLDETNLELDETNLEADDDLSDVLVGEEVTSPGHVPRGY